MATLEQLQAEFDAQMQRDAAFQQQQQQAMAERGALDAAALQQQQAQSDAFQQQQQQAMAERGALDAAQLQQWDKDRLAREARDAAMRAWEEANLQYYAKNPEGIYTLDDPFAYYKAYGTIPIQSLGSSRYGVTEAGGRDVAKGAEGIKYLTPETGSTYALYSPKSGKTLGTASTPEELAELVRIARQQTTSQGRKADWQLYQQAPGADKPTLLASDLYNSDLTTLGKIVATGLPIATAFIPGLNLLGTIATQAVAGGLSAAMQDRDPFTGALIAGGTAGLLKGTGLDKVISKAVGLGGPAMGKVAETAAERAAQEAAEAGLGDIVVTAIRQGASPSLARAIGAGAASLAPNIIANMSPLEAVQFPELTQPPSAAPEAALETVGEEPITFIGTRSPGLTVDPSILTRAGAGLIGAGVTSGRPPAAQPGETVGTEDIIAQANKLTPPNTNAGAAIGAGVGGLSNLVTGPGGGVIDATTGEIVAQANTQTQPTNTSGSAIGAGVGGLSNLVTGPGGGVIDATTGEIVAQANPQTQPNTNAGSAIGATIPQIATPTSTPTDFADAQSTGQAEVPKKDGLSVGDYLQLLGLGLGLVGGATSGSKQGNAVIPGGLGSGFSPVFGSELPAANLPGLGAGGAGLGPRTPSDLAARGLASPIDYYRYGYGPEQSFFANVPQGARNTSRAYTGYEEPFRGIENMAEGGYAVGGPGDGRDDKIPAMLSDGEYVMDAETVAMLGNGSSKAGAQALDRFRVNIRKHKGKALAKGSFSVNAKKPEQYLKKGRA